MIWLRTYFVLSWLSLGVGVFAAGYVLRRYDDSRGGRRELWVLVVGILALTAEALLVWSTWLAPTPHAVLRLAPLVPLIVLLLIERLEPSAGSRRRVLRGGLGVAILASVALVLAPASRDGWAVLMGVTTIVAAGVGMMGARTAFRHANVVLVALLLPIVVVNVLPRVWVPRLSALAVTALINVQLALLAWRFVRDRKGLVARFGLVRRKYETTPMADETLARIRFAVERAMESEKVFLDADLSLSSFAERLGYASNQISQVVNRAFDQNFNDYVNAQRIRYACSMLRRDPEQTVLAVCFAAGFNNKSTFNAAFRKLTGTTPTAYRTQSRDDAIQPRS